GGALHLTVAGKGARDGPEGGEKAHDVTVSTRARARVNEPKLSVHGTMESSVPVERIPVD
ncbi:MAG: hypothetical protein E6Z13_04270, partial [Dermabacter sp.]|nr:hypothetical protein [Dermabacter sp.]